MLCILIRYVVSPGPGELARYVVEVYTGVAPVLATEPNGPPSRCRTTPTAPATTAPEAPAPTTAAPGTSASIDDNGCGPPHTGV